MLYVAGALLAGWILNLFGFDGLVISGMLELFNLEITKTSYYFIFGIIGMLKFVVATPKGEVKKMKSWSEIKEEAERDTQKKFGKRI